MRLHIRSQVYGQELLYRFVRKHDEIVDFPFIYHTAGHRLLHPGHRQNGVRLRGRSGRQDCPTCPPYAENWVALDQCRHGTIMERRIIGSGLDSINVLALRES